MTLRNLNASPHDFSGWNKLYAALSGTGTFTLQSANTTWGINLHHVDIAPGDRIFARASVSSTTDSLPTVRIEFHDADGNQISTAIGQLADGITSVGAVAPDGTTNIYVTYYVTDRVDEGSSFTIDDGMFCLGGTPPDWPAYHDGDSPGWQWDGTPNASTSSAIAAPTIALPTRLNMRMANTTHLKIRG